MLDKHERDLEDWRRLAVASYVEGRTFADYPTTLEIVRDQMVKYQEQILERAPSTLNLAGDGPVVTHHPTPQQRETLDRIEELIEAYSSVREGWK